MPGRVSVMAGLVWISASAFLKNTVIGRVSVWFKWCGNTSKNGRNVRIDHYSFFCVPAKVQGDSLLTPRRSSFGCRRQQLVVNQEVRCKLLALLGIII